MKNKNILWSRGVASRGIPLPVACEATALPIELQPLTIAIRKEKSKKSACYYIFMQSQWKMTHFVIIIYFCSQV